MQTSRGFNADVIVIDEAAFINENLLMDTIFPVVAQKNTSLIAISTPDGEENHFTRLTRLEDKATKKRLFNVIHVGGACDECKRSETAYLCNHKKMELPSWKSARKQQRMAVIYEGNQERNMRENFGLITSNGGSYFPAKEVAALRDAPLIRFAEEVRVIFVGADPSGGGSSDLAMTAMTIANGRWVIVGLFATSLRGNVLEQEDRVRQFFSALRARYPNAVAVFIPEAAPAQEADHLAEALRPYRRWVCIMQETVGNRAGVPKRRESAEEMGCAMSHQLAAGGIAFSEHLVSIGGTAPELKKKLLVQMGNFAWRDDGRGRQKKLHGKVGGQNDDLLISALIVPFHAAKFYRQDREAYTRYQKAILATGGPVPLPARIPVSDGVELAAWNQSLVARYAC